MKYFILAGEASGDLHSAALASALREQDEGADIRGWGGDEMASAGVKILKHYRELAFMGFVEVLRHLPQIWRNFREAKAQIEAFRPDALILVDYPGFNLRMAKWAFRKGIRVFYYISPQLWAWKESRVKTVRASIEQMYVIIPFETEFYAKHGIDVEYVGHPLAWRIFTRYKEKRAPAGQGKRLVLLPGSRKREIQHMLPTMLAAVTELQGFKVYIAGAPSVPPSLYYHQIVASGVKGVTVTFGYTYSLLQTATAAFCTSGTATLETALFDVPQVVCYKGDRLSYMLARQLVKVAHIAMVNLICGKEVVPELIQDDFNPSALKRALDTILAPERSQQIHKDYAALKDKLVSGNPADHVAQDLIQRLQST